MRSDLAALVAIALALTACEHRESNREASELVLVRVENAIGVIFPAPLAKRVINTCTRNAPALVDGYWTPTSNDVAIAEELFGAFLAESAPCYAKVTPANSKFYRRQYAGFLRGNRRFIYVNLFHQRQIELVSDWIFEPVSMCDGGLDYFGVEFDVTSGRFQHLEFTQTFQDRGVRRIAARLGRVARGAKDLLLKLGR